MFTVLCRHTHSDWQNTEAFLYVIGKSNIILNKNETTISNILTINILQKYLHQRESTHENVQSCPSNEKRDFTNMNVCIISVMLTLL